MNEKKFLDAAGITYLWKKLSLQDYPNNQELAAVVEAIDETKMDKESIISIEEIDAICGAQPTE